VSELPGGVAGIAVRPAHAGDIDAMLTIENQLFGSDAWSRAQLVDELVRIGDTRWYCVAERADVIVGYAGLYLSPPDADVQTVAVSREVQGGGVGRTLLAAAVAAAWDAGCSRIFLEVRADNPSALALYRAAGFVPMGRRRGYYSGGVDAVTMRLRRHELPPLEASHG
jgi:ribosomal-protein-alanine N-acetyltransferase